MNCKQFTKKIMVMSCGALLLGCDTEPEFQIKDGVVYYKASNYKDLRYHEGLKKLDADAETFRILEDGSYAKDNRSVFYQEKMISGADVATFEGIGELMGKDRSRGYFMNYPLAGSDGKSFRRLNDKYAIDQHQAYYGKEIIKGADAARLEIVDSKLGLSRDGRSYYKNETKLPVKDYQTFVQLSGDFWKDKYFVYYIYNPVNPERVMLEGMDAESAKSLNHATIKDKYGCHNGYERIECP